MKVLGCLVPIVWVNQAQACQVTNAMHNCYCEDNTLICKTIKTEWQGMVCSVHVFIRVFLNTLESFFFETFQAGQPISVERIVHR